MSENLNDLDVKTKEKVLARIRKMLALADPNSGATEGERDNAMRMAQATMAKYNLHLAQVESAGGKTDEKRGLGSMTLPYDQPWVRTICSAIAHLMFCEYFYTRYASGGKNVKHFFVGRETNVKTAQELATFITNSVDREGARMARERAGQGGGGTYWRSFCKGAAYRIYQRCETIRKDAERASAAEVAKLPRPTTGTALVLASVYESEKKANLAVIDAQVGELKTKRVQQRNTNWDAHSDGQNYGDRVNLTPMPKDDKRRLT